MTVSGLTESSMSGKIKSPKVIYPGFAGRCGPPLRRAVSFLGVESPQQITSAVGPAGPMKSTARAQTSPKTGQASRQQCTTHEQDKAPQRLPTREVQEEHVTASREEQAPEDHIHDAAQHFTPSASQTDHPRSFAPGSGRATAHDSRWSRLSSVLGTMVMSVPYRGVRRRRHGPPS